MNMKNYTIKFELISEIGYHTELTFDECYDIFITDSRFEFTDEISGFRYNYYLKDIPETQSAKKIYNIRVIENELLNELQRRIDKAIDYLENCINGYDEQYEQHTFSYQFVDYDLKNILEILKGDSNE